MNGTVLASTATTAAWPQVARSRGRGVRVSTQITSSVSAPRAHRANATRGGATPASSAILISAKLEPQTAEGSTKPCTQARDDRACERVIGTALASGRDRRRTPVVPADRPGRRGPVGGGPRGRRGHLGPGRDGRRGARSGAAVRVVDGGGRRRLHPRRGTGPLGRRHGFAADHVHRLRLVTVDGRPHEIDADRAPELFWRCAVPARAASASSPSWSSRCSRSPACTGAGCSCPAPPPRSCCTCGAMGTYTARRGRHVGGAAAAAPPPVAPPGAARARGGPPALHPRRAPRRGRGAARPAARGRHATARRRPRAPPSSPRRARTCPRRWTWWSCGRWVARWSVRRRCATSSPDAARRNRCGCGARWCRGVLAFPVSPGLR